MIPKKKEILEKETVHVGEHTTHNIRVQQEGKSIESFVVEIQRGVRGRKGGTHGRERPLPIAASCSPAQLACLKTFFLMFKYIFDTHELHLISVYLVNKKRRRERGERERRRKRNVDRHKVCLTFYV